MNKYILLILSFLIGFIIYLLINNSKIIEGQQSSKNCFKVDSQGNYISFTEDIPDSIPTGASFCNDSTRFTLMNWRLTHNNGIKVEKILPTFNVDRFKLILHDNLFEAIYFDLVACSDGSCCSDESSTTESECNMAGGTWTSTPLCVSTYPEGERVGVGEHWKQEGNEIKLKLDSTEVSSPIDGLFNEFILNRYICQGRCTPPGDDSPTESRGDYNNRYPILCIENDSSTGEANWYNLIPEWNNCDNYTGDRLDTLHGLTGFIMFNINGIDTPKARVIDYLNWVSFKLHGGNWNNNTGKCSNLKFSDFLKNPTEITYNTIVQSTSNSDSVEVSKVPEQVEEELDLDTCNYCTSLKNLITHSESRSNCKCPELESNNRWQDFSVCVDNSDLCECDRELANTEFSGDHIPFSHDYGDTYNDLYKNHINRLINIINNDLNILNDQDINQRSFDDIIINNCDIETNKLDRLNYEIDCHVCMCDKILSSNKCINEQSGIRSISPVSPPPEIQSLDTLAENRSTISKISCANKIKENMQYCILDEGEPCFFKESNDILGNKIGFVNDENTQQIEFNECNNNECLEDNNRINMNNPGLNLPNIVYNRAQILKRFCNILPHPI